MEELFEASNVDYCVQPEQDCSHVQSNNSYSSFSVGPVPCYLSIVSDTLSCIACVTMLAIYITWADIRQNIAQAIVTFIAIADFLTAAGYLTGSFNLLTHVFTDRRPDRRGCDVFTTVCEVQSYIVTYATMSSYFWTIILAFHFYMTIAQERPNFTKRLLPFYHLIAWGVPILIAFPLLCVGKLAYAPFVTGMWCYMEIYRNSPPFGDNGTAVSVITQLPEIVAFFLIIVLFSLTWITIYKQVCERSKLMLQTWSFFYIHVLMVPLCKILGHVIPFGCCSKCQKLYFQHRLVTYSYVANKRVLGFRRL